MKHGTKKCISLLLLLFMLLGMAPSIAHAEGEGQAVRCAFPCDAPGAVLTVTDASGAVVAAEADGSRMLLPGGSYYLYAAAEGYAPIEGHAFSVPADAAGDQELCVVMSKLNEAMVVETSEDNEFKESAPNEEPTDAAKPVGGIFAARFSKYQVFEVQRRPNYPTGTQQSPNPITVRELAAPAGLSDLGEEDYFFFTGLGPASQTGVAVSDYWNSRTEGLDPYTVNLYVKTGEDTIDLGSGVIGALSSQGFLFVTNGKGYWVSNNRGYRYASTSVTYTPAANGRLVCDLNLLTSYPAQSMLQPDPGAPTHIHCWDTTSKGNAVIFVCTEDGCPFGTNTEYRMWLSVPEYVLAGRQVQARLEKSAPDAAWPEELEQNVIRYVGRDGTEYAESVTAPTALGTYTALVKVGYRQDVRELKADFAIVAEEPAALNETKTIDGVTVTAQAAPGTFPNGTTLRLMGMGRNKALAMAEAAGIEAVDGVAVDIAFITREGESVQPAAGKTVEISIGLDRTLEGSRFTVLHESAAPTRGAKAVKSAATANVETVAATASATAASFEGSSFSVYGIVGSEYDDGNVLHYYRNTYTFYAGDPSEPQSSWPAIDERIYRDGDTATVPGSPGGDSRNVFKGWFYTDEHGDTVEIRTGDTIVIDPATQEAAEAAGTEQSDHHYDVYAVFGRRYTCTFYTDESMQLVYRSFLEETDHEVMLPDPYDLDQPLLIESGKTFLGWKKPGDPDSAIVPGPSVTIEEEDLQFVPVIVPAHRVEFDLVKPLFDDVSVARQMVPNGVQVAQPEGFAVGQIYRGYKLTGWYKTYDEGSYSDPFDFTQPLTASDPDVITLYADWVPTPVPFTVVPYTEDQNAVSYTARPGDAATLSGMADSELPVEQILEQFPNKKYNDRTSSIPGVCHWSGTGSLDDDPVNGIMVDGRILPVIQVLDKDGNVTAEYDVDADEWVGGVVGTISPDGSTVVRMNYNRDRYKLSFVFVNRGYTITEATTSYISSNNRTYPAGTTLNEFGMSKAPEGYDNSNPLPVITVKHAQHLYKVTHQVYDYGAVFDPFFSKEGWYYEKSGMDSDGQTVFDASNTSMPIKPKTNINDGDEESLKVGLWLNDIQKTYIYISNFYQATSWEEIEAGAPLIQSSEMRINYICTGTTSGVQVGHGHGFEIGKVSANGYQLIAVTNQAGYKKENGAISYPAVDPVTTAGNYTWYAKDGYSEAGGGEATPIYLHHIPARFSITFKQTQNGTVDGWNVSDDTKEESIVIPGNYYNTDISAILAEYEPTDWTTLKDVRGIEYAALPGWKGDVNESGAFPETMPPKNIVFYKEWTPLSFTAVFHPNNGGEETEQSVLIGGRIERIPNPTKTDEIFGGWYLNEGCTMDCDFSTIIDMAEYERLKGEDGKVHLYGKWNSPNPYYVLYDPGEGELSSALVAQLDANHMDKESYYANAKVPVKGVAQEDGKAFIGWRIGESDIILQHGNTFLADSVNDKADGVEDQIITLVAQFAEYGDTTSVTYHSNFPDGTPDKQSSIINLVTNGSYTIPCNASDLGFIPNNRLWVFIGWNTAADGSGDFFQKAETPAVGISDNHLYAIWELRIPRKDIPVIKVWKDGNDRSKLRPTEITVTLLADGMELPDVPPITLSEENGWSGVFRDLPCMDESGKTIVYSVRESNCPKGYTVSISGSWAIGFTITNSFERPHSPFTGDHTPWLPWLGALLLSGGMLTLDALIRSLRRPRYTGKHGK